MKTSLFLIVALLISLRLDAQAPCTCTGQVIDQKTGAPVPYAVVEVNGVGQYADAEGRFSLRDQTMPILLEASQLGYARGEFSHHQCSESLRLALAPYPIELSTILFEKERRNKTATTVLDGFQGASASQPTDIGDLLKAYSGFNLIKRGGYAMDPIFRGFKAEQLNIIYDGGVQVMHACPGRMDPISTHVNPEAVQKIEVIRGPFSVRHGQALAGTVNIITRDADGSPGWGGFIETGYEMNGNAKLVQAGLHFSGAQTGIRITGSSRDFGSYQNGTGRVIPTAYQAYDYSLAAKWKPADDQLLRATWRQSFGRDILHAGLMMDTESDDASVLSLDYEIKNIGAPLYKLSFKAYASQVDHIMSNKNRPNRMMVDALASVQSQTQGARAEANWMPDQKLVLFTGLDYRRTGRKGDRIRSVKRNMATGERLEQALRFVDPIWQDAVIQQLGGFTELRYLMKEQISWVTGFRLDYLHATAHRAAENFLAYYPGLQAQTAVNLSMNTTIQWQPSEAWNWQFSLGRGTRAPNMIERYINHFNVGVDGFEYLGNPYLQAENNYQAEISSQFESERLFLGGNLFYAHVHDYIGAAVDTSLSRKYMPMQEPRYARRFRNIDEVLQAGFELNATWQWTKKLEVGGDVAYTYAYNREWSEPLAQIAPFEVGLGLKYEQERWWAKLTGRLVAAQNRISNTFGETVTPGFQTWDFRAGFELLEDLRLGFSVQNIFNENYYQHLSFRYRNMPESGILFDPGRNVSFVLKYTIH